MRHIRLVFLAKHMLSWFCPVNVHGQENCTKYTVLNRKENMLLCYLFLPHVFLITEYFPLFLSSLFDTPLQHVCHGPLPSVVFSSILHSASPPFVPVSV